MKAIDLQLKQILDKYNYVGVSIIHTTKDEVDYHQNFGVNDLDEKKNLNSDNIFRIASISKVVVALAVMKLYEQGLVDFDEDISKYLGFTLRNPHFPKTPITLKMLMTQTSSIFDGGEDEVGGYDYVNGPSMYVSLEDLLTNPEYPYYTSKTYLPYEPGTYFCYSNFGCGILACIVERVTGKLFTEYIKEYVLHPLQLDASFRSGDIQKKDLFASLYDYTNEGFVCAKDKRTIPSSMFPIYPVGDNFRGPAGGLYISPNGLAKIMLMLINNGTYDNIKVFESSTIKLMKQTHWHGESSEPEYKKKGLQLLQLDGYSKDTLMGHFGYAYGLRSFMLFNDHDGYIFMCNGADYQGFAEHMTHMQEDVIKYLVGKFENHE